VNSVHKGILLVGSYPPPFGGVPTHIEYLANYLAERDWDVHVLALVGKQTGVERHGSYTVYRPSQFMRWSSLLSPSPILLKQLLPFRELATASPKMFLRLIGIANLIRRIVVQHDLRIISAYHLFSAGIASAWVSEQLSIPLITTIFGDIYAQPDFHKKHLTEVQYILHQSKRMLSCSDHCARSFALLGLSPPVETVYYGIDLDRFHPENDGTLVRKRLGISPSDPIVLFVGRMTRELGLHVLLESIPQVLQANANIKFMIVGTTGELTGAAQQISDRYPGHVFVMPDIPNQELPFYYGAATIGVAPSINERACLGLALAEAMATAKPTIGVAVGGTAEVVIEGETGLLVPPANGSALAEAILSLTHDADRMEKFGRLGRLRAEQVFDKEVANRRMEQIFYEVLT
jgi:glycosyltransferase involved in cell wall biosynthesis